MRARSRIAQALATTLCAVLLLPAPLPAETARVVVTYDYDAFGNLLHSTGSTPNNYLFAGEQFDPDLGLYYLRARHLNVSTGRFWTMDSAEPKHFRPKTLHRYIFAVGDPINRFDPSGLDDIGEEVFAASEEQTLGAVEDAGAQQVGAEGENLAMDAAEQAGGDGAVQTPNALGRFGENFVSKAENLAVNTTERIPSLSDTAEFRVPDFLDKARSIIGDAKNVSYLRWTTQLQDFYQYAKATGLTLYIFVRAGGGTQLSQELQELRDLGEVVIKEIIPKQ
jgi:RHS repeat-associated protein